MRPFGPGQSLILYINLQVHGVSYKEQRKRYLSIFLRTTQICLPLNVPKILELAKF